MRTGIPTYLFLLVLTLVPNGLAWGDGGDLLWQDRFDPIGRNDTALDVAAGWGRVVAVGSTESAAGDKDIVVRTYDAKTGELLWHDQVDLSSRDDEASAVVMDSRCVIVVGTGTDAAENKEFLVRAYDVKQGMLLWEDRSVFSSFSAGAHGVDMDSKRIVVVGHATDSDGQSRIIVRAYEPETGRLLWGTQSPMAGERGVARAVALKGPWAYVVGWDNLVGRLGPFVSVRAYDLETGAIRWESVNSTNSRALYVAVSAGRVIVVGQGGDSVDDFLIRAQDAQSGELMWEDRTFVSTGYDNAAVAVDNEGKRAFVAGWVKFEPEPGYENTEAFLVRAYDVSSGLLLWEDKFLPSKCLCHALDIAEDSGRVFAVGRATSSFVVRSYEANTGELLWQDQFIPNPDLVDYFETGARGIATQQGRVFVVGVGKSGAGDSDFIIRAYEAK